MKIIEQFKDEIKEYCISNNLNFDKVISSPKCWNDKILFIQHLDSTKGNQGLLNEEPAEVLLTVRKIENDKIIIEKGINASKYLN
jgi:hypothetical protein